MSCFHLDLLATARIVRDEETSREEVRVEVRCWGCGEKMLFDRTLGVASTLNTGHGVYTDSDRTELRAAFKNPPPDGV